MIEGQKFARKCSVTGEGMNQGYVINGGDEYYKDAGALNTKYTDQEWEQMYNNGQSDSYYTDWDEEEDYQYIVKNGELVEIE